MTDASPGIEHYVEIFTGIITFVGFFLVHRAGDKEGVNVADEANVRRTMGTVGSAIVDRASYTTIVDGLEQILHRLDHLIKIGEAKGEQELRDHLRDDMRNQFNSLMSELKRKENRDEAQHRGEEATRIQRGEET